ncbi:hypothetical protein [Kineosporia succinea]|uniref:Uncharacterized protein n=1 Tax=Kineosporia succinea TaxID=84632 RepID=A0ABT9P515_9ACTN|nr:hypothetical protein [Kineosporia succinea]MDP9827767.1 hypothetical protein [Kineosporia succinea]
MNAQQITIAAAVILILVGLLLIGLGTRPTSAAVHVPVEEADPSGTGTGELPEVTAMDALADPADPPEDVEDPTPPLAVVETRPFVPLVRPGHESTPPERHRCRDQVGPGLDADLAEVVRLLESKSPELRGMLLNTSSAVVAQELAVLRAYLRGALTGLDTRLRNGPAHEGDRDTVACLVAGLNRLPVHHGACFHRAPRGEVRLNTFFPGSVLTEPAFTRADRNAFPASGVDAGPLVNYVIWSETGRRTPLLVGHTDTVMFDVTTRFRVLAIDQQHGDATVYLFEEADRPSPRARRENQVLEHLRTRAAAAGVGPIDGPAPSPVSHPGLDDFGRPYALRTDAETESVR